MSDYIARFEREYRVAVNAAENTYQDANTRTAIRTMLENVAKETLKFGVRNPSLHHQLVTMRTNSIKEIIEEAEKFDRKDRAYRTGRWPRSLDVPFDDKAVNMVNTTSDDRLDIMEKQVAGVEKQVTEQTVRMNKIEEVVNRLDEKVDANM